MASDMLHKICGIPEIIEDILMYLSAKDREEVRFACRDFYKAICHMERSKLIVKLDDKVSLRLSWLYNHHKQSYP